ncbi:MAG: ABC transporter substrate-binding protein [Clostridia bacterium]|nr:ABC transporter substrate-binding protein [Clostridia bacterium]
MKLKKIFALVLAVVLMASCFTGCGSKKADKNTINIKAVNLGFGVDWLNALKTAYEKDNPGKKVNITVLMGQEGVESIQTEMESLSGGADIYFTRPKGFHSACYQGAVSIEGQKFDCVYADLSDIWTAEYEGENGATMESKMNPAFADYLKVNGKYYGVPWAVDFMGIVRNKDVWSTLGLTDDDIPATTDELLELCAKINQKSKELKSSGKIKNAVSPFIFAKNEEYYTSVYPIWMEQYEGKENMGYFKNGLDPIGESSYNLYSYTGQKESLKFLNQLLKKDGDVYVYQHKDSDSISFTEMQSYFLLNQAAMCINGSWLEIEMNKNGDGKSYNIDMIKTPVISALANKLSFGKAGGADEKLRQLVAFVDAHPQAGDNGGAPAFASTEDIETVREARSYSFVSGGYDHTALVPAYAVNVDGAKDFLKYMYSDKGLSTYCKTLNGYALPATPTKAYDSSVKASAFTKSINTILAENLADDYATFVKTKVYCLGGVNLYLYNGSSNAVWRLIEGDSVEKIIADNQNHLKTNWPYISGQIK